jgi:hypothetical protein
LTTDDNAIPRDGPKHELDDLENAPCEFRTLVDSPAHAETLADRKPKSKG